MSIVRQLLYPTKNNILNPLSVIVKLFIFSYYDKNSKLSIINNKIIIQENSYLQSTYRTINGDTKNDINILFFPILYACQKYIYNNEKKNIFEKIFNETLFSLDKLNETYKGDEIINNINNLKNIITSFIEIDEIKINVINSNNSTEIYEIKKNIYSHLDKIWNENRINILFSYVEEILNSKTKELEKILINSLSIFMDFIDSLTLDLLKNLNP